MTNLARLLLLTAGASASACAPAPVACADYWCCDDLSCEPPDATSPPLVDAGQPLPPPGIDAGQIWPTPLPPSAACNEADADRWARAHRSTELVDALRACSLEPCEGADCAYSTCVAARVGATSCEPCIAHEIDCLLRECGPECGSNAAASCAGCLCANACVRLFDACARIESQACGPCRHGAGNGLAPNLLTAILVAAIL